MKITAEQIKQLREETGAGIMDCRKALEQTNGDLEKAREILRQQGIETALKKSERIVGNGLIETYTHSNGRVAAMVELLCETDFVAKNLEFKNLAHEIAMQVASMDPADVTELSKQEWIRDNGRTIDDLIKEAIAKFKENIVLKKFIRFEIGGE